MLKPGGVLFLYVAWDWPKVLREDLRYKPAADFQNPKNDGLLGGDGIALAPDLANGVNSASLTFKVGSHQDLAQKAGTEHQQAREEKKHTRDQQRPVYGHDVVAQ